MRPISLLIGLFLFSSLPAQTKARTIDFDFYLMLGGGFWTGTFQDYYSQPTGLYNAGISIPFKTWSLGFDITGASATAREDRIVQICRDPNDDYLLAICLDGQADVLITGDKDLLVLQSFGSTRIITINDFESLIP